MARFCLGSRRSHLCYAAIWPALLPLEREIAPGYARWDAQAAYEALTNHGALFFDDLLAATGLLAFTVRRSSSRTRGPRPSHLRRLRSNSCSRCRTTNAGAFAFRLDQRNIDGGRPIHTVAAGLYFRHSPGSWMRRNEPRDGHGCYWNVTALCSAICCRANRSPLRGEI